MRRFLSSAALTIATVAAGVAMAPSTANAAPTNCESGRRNVGGYPSSFGHCDSGSGSVRAWIECYNDAGRKTRYYGPWKYAGVTSIAYCNSTYYSFAANGLQTRN